MVPSIYGILILILALIVSAEGMLYLAIIATLFGATAAVYATALGGANVTPAVMVQIFVAWRVLRKEGFSGFFVPMTFLSPGFWLMLLTVWGGVSAAALPRFFKGQFTVNALDRDSTMAGGTQVIGPVSMNITQGLYAALGLFTFVAMRTTLERPGAVQRMAKAVLWLAGLNVLAGLLDLAQHHLGLFPVLLLLKNGTYALMGGEVAGLMRIAGTFSETSTFSTFTLTLLAFTHTLWINKVYTKWAAGLSICNLVLLLISTSGTAYVGLGVCFAITFAFSIWYFMRHGDLGKYSLYMWMAALGVVGGAAVLLFVPGAFEAVSEYFGVVIGKKMTSDSGTIRMAMNALAYKNFFDTFGLGTGLGSNRSASFALVLLSNMGWMGVFFFGMFLWRVLMDKRRAALPSAEAAIVLASRHAVLANLIAACISASAYDLGVLFYIMAAGAVAPQSAQVLDAARSSSVEEERLRERPRRQLTGLS